MLSKVWSRREFVQWLGYSSLSTAGLCSSLSATPIERKTARFAYVGSVGGEHEGIHAYAIRQGRWEKLQALESERPVALALAPNQRVLYVVNGVDLYRGLPMGTVEAFAIQADGRLTLLNRRELALSAVNPRHAAVAPDGRSLVVAVEGGGAYNVLGIKADGRLGRVSGLRKEIGVERTGESYAARPKMVAFDQAGRVLSVDGGTDQLNVFALAEGTNLTAHERFNLQPGCVPSQMKLSTAGDKLYIMQAGAISCHGYDAVSGKVSQQSQHLPFSGVVEGASSMVVHPSGDFLYACQRGGGIAAWTVSRVDGRLRSIDMQALALGEIHAIEIAPDGRSLTGLNREHGQVVEMEIDRVTGQLRTDGTVARLSSPSSLALLYS